MNKEFIPYEQALALKELGFDEECFAFYDESLYFPNNENQYGTFCNQKIDVSSCSAPLYQQAFRWFREKYGYTIVILYSEFQIIRELSISSTISRETGELEPIYLKTICHIEKTKNYEEAELACLKKIIEIVKIK